VNSRALNEVFRVVNERGAGANGGVSYAVKVSCVEIYNETVRDLFVDPRQKAEAPKLDIRQGPNGPYIPDLTELSVSHTSQVQELMTTRAWPNRSVAATAMNAHSSRSHLLLFVNVMGHNPVTEEKTFGKLILIGQFIVHQ
jgi:kinesin family protein C2/C3